MASPDNVRVRYEEGLILGAAQLSGDQTYFRAAHERRSLSRDTFGVTWGLELSVETASTGPSSAIVWLDPGVAYGGDGKAIIVRERTEISSKLREAQSVSPGVFEWRVFVSYAETERQGKRTYQYCGQAMDPITTEGYRVEVEPAVGIGLAANQREAARVAPQSQLGGPSDPKTDRVQLGVVRFDPLTVNASPTVVRQPSVLRVPEPVSPPQNEVDGDPTNAPAQVEYVGLVCASLTHPRGWSSSLGKQNVAPAIRLDPESGIHLAQPTVAHANVRVDGTFYAPKAIVVSEAGVCVVFAVASGTAATSLLNKAVQWDKTKAGVVAADANSKTVVGIAVAVEATAAGADAGVRVVVSGPALAELSGADPDPGTWLVASGGGQVSVTGSPTAGSLVGKVIAGAPQNKVQMIVSLA